MPYNTRRKAKPGTKGFRQAKSHGTASLLNSSESDDDTPPAFLAPQLMAGTLHKLLPKVGDKEGQRQLFTGTGPLLEVERWVNWRRAFFDTLDDRNILHPQDRWRALGHYLGEIPKLTYSTEASDMKTQGLVATTNTVDKFLNTLQKTYVRCVDIPIHFQFALADHVSRQKGSKSVTEYAERLLMLARLSDIELSLDVLHLLFLIGLPPHLKGAYMLEGHRRVADEKTGIRTMDLKSNLLTHLQISDSQAQRPPPQDNQKDKRQLASMTAKVEQLQEQVMHLNVMSSNQASGLEPNYQQIAAYFGITVQQAKERRKSYSCYGCGSKDHQANNCPRKPPKGRPQ